MHQQFAQHVHNATTYSVRLVRCELHEISLHSVIGKNIKSVTDEQWLFITVF